MSQFGYIDIEHEELEQYFEAVKEKVGVCDILPRARFSLRTIGDIKHTGIGIKYNGLVCSEKMGERQTGIGAESCQNCLIEKGLA